MGGAQAPAAGRKRINLALQGGGAHGAFTWGVLDVLLRDPDIEIAGISGTSAGALNGAAVKSGLVQGGTEGAIANLDELWSGMGARADSRLLSWMTEFGPGASAVARAIEYSLPYSFAETWARLVSPYAYGPMFQNPLRSVVDTFDYDTVCDDHGPRLFICATNVRTGKVRVFTREEIDTNVILASACLPTLFQAVEIKDKKTGETDAYWDGGYTSNPALFPLYAPDLPDDVVIININPLERAEKPVTPQEIQSRINEISFNASLMSELRSIAFVQRLLAQGAITKGDMKDVKVHMIADDALMTDLSVATKSVPTPYMLSKLKAAGQDAAHMFLETHKPDLNVRGTVDLAATYG